MDRQAWDTLAEHITALDAQCAAQAEALRATPAAGAGGLVAQCHAG